MGRIHCMYTSANKPFSLFWYITSRQPFFMSTFGCAATAHRKQHEKVHKTLLNEQTLLAGFCLSYIWKDDPIMEKGKKKKRKKTPSNNKSVTTANVEHLSSGSFQYQFVQKQIYNIGGHECFMKRGISHPTGLLWVEK